MVAARDDRLRVRKLMVGTETLDVCDLSTEMFDRFAQFIGSELGIKMPDSKRTMIQSRLLRRVRELHLQSVEEYGQYFFASANSEERHHFINAVTTHKTDFFREPQHFDYLARVALPTLHRHAEGLNYRLGAWSGACSSGEEPYTLAMVLDQYARQQAGFDFAILATDVSLTIVETGANRHLFRSASQPRATRPAQEVPVAQQEPISKGWFASPPTCARGSASTP